MRRNRTLLLLCLCSGCAFAGMGDWVPFETVDGEFVLSVKINDIDTKASIETDGLANSINESFLKQHDIPFDKHSRFTLSFMDADLEMSRLSYYEGDPDIGLRFQPWFDVAPIFQVDYAQSRLRILTRKAVNLYGRDNVKIKKGRGGFKNVSALTVVDGEKYYFAMGDPRATFTTVSRELAKNAGWLDNYKISPSGLGGNVVHLKDYDVMQVPNVAFGPIEFDYLIIVAYKQSEFDDRVVTNLDNRASRTRLYDGVFGLDALSNFVVTYDYHRGKVHIDTP